MRLPGMIVAVCALLAFAQQPAQTSDDDLARVVADASAWSARFEQGLSGLLFREKYLETIDGGSPATQGTISRVSGRRERLTEANVFLLRADSTGEFVLFRDVYISDGREVADHTARLERLLTDGSAQSVEQARRLTDASARHNIGRVNRNINTPTMAFRYLEATRSGGVQFTRAGDATVNGLPTAIAEFEGVGSPTLVRGAGGSDVPARGRYWIPPGSGAVVRAHVDFAGKDVSGRIEIDLMLHEKLAAWVPQEMTEVWRAYGQRTTGLAQYDRYQRLSVSTGEIIK